MLYQQTGPTSYLCWWTAIEQRKTWSLVARSQSLRDELLSGCDWPYPSIDPRPVAPEIRLWRFTSYDRGLQILSVPSLSTNTAAIADLAAS